MATLSHGCGLWQVRQVVETVSFSVGKCHAASDCLRVVKLSLANYSYLILGAPYCLILGASLQELLNSDLPIFVQIQLLMIKGG